MRTIRKVFLFFVLVLGLTVSGCQPVDTPIQAFDGERAFQDAATQVGFGSRSPGTPGHAEIRQWLSVQLAEAGWAVEIHPADYQDIPIYNLVAERSNGSDQDQKYWVILGTHYDTRFVSDRDPDPAKREMPLIGANDGASGVAVLTELARVLPDFENVRVSLVFFDAEDNGDLPGWEWIIGSSLFVEQLSSQPDAVVIVDMIGDADQQFYREKTSDPALTNEIWSIAKDLGKSSFIDEGKYAIIDDHTPFLNAGIPAVDIIDFDYPYWHTTEDTLDKVSPQSLANVGEVLQEWLIRMDEDLSQSE